MGRSGDAEFEAYVADRGPAWERYAFVITGDPHRAQDLLQTVLLKAFRRWRRITAVEHPDAYVRRMITNSYLDFKRRRSSSEIATDSPPDDRHSPDPAVGVVERDEMHRALLQLSPHQRAVLVLRHVEGLTDEEIAGMLDCSVGTVRTHAARGKERFRAALMTAAALGTGRDAAADLPEESR